MKKFKFSLQTVLKWKHSQEEEALATFGQAMKARQEAYDTLQTSRRHLGALLNAIRQARAENAQTWAQVTYLREVARQEALCSHHEELLQSAAVLQEKAREAYLLRRREAEALQKLKEKRSKLYQKDVDRATEKELEEIMLSREGNLLCS